MLKFFLLLLVFLVGARIIYSIARKSWDKESVQMKRDKEVEKVEKELNL